MNSAFRRHGSRVDVRLAAAEVEVLKAIPVLLEGALGDDGEPDWSRSRDVAHPDDPEAAERFKELTGEMLDDARTADRERLAATVDEPALSLDDAEAWMRVIGDARLLLAARMGIEGDGWNEEPEAVEPIEMSVLRLLGYLQDALVVELMDML